MKAFFDKYKYILGLGFALAAVIIIAIVSSAAGKNTAENDGVSYSLPETSSFTTAAGIITTAASQTNSNTQTPSVTTCTDTPQSTASQTAVSQTASQAPSDSKKPETAASNTSATPAPVTTRLTSAATEKPVITASTTVTTAAKATAPKPDDKPIKTYGNTCTFVIECKTILNNKDKLKKGLERYVPDDAVIFSGTAGFDDGESVYDILRRICDGNSIQMEASFTPAFSSYYIEGINNLYEFDCGNNSGWMYSVNGVFPNYGCSSYKPVNNDRIEFRYTCELGYDLYN